MHSNNWKEHPTHHTTRQLTFVHSIGRHCSEPGHQTNAVLPLTNIKWKGSYYQLTHPAGYECSHTKPPPITFHHYISNLEEWGKHILTHWTFKTTEQAAFVGINLAQELYYVTIGRANDGIGYFGWLITTDTNILIEGKGQALRKDSLVESLRAKIYCGLALFTFLKHFYI
eukprot:6612437-Ditylum_brightwellii.AAC.1